MMLLAAYNVLLWKYTEQEDIIVGSPTAGRPHQDIEGVIGMFVNTLAMRNSPVGNKSFAQFLGEVKENSLKAFENQDYQFDTLVEKLNLKRDLSLNPLFDTMLILLNADRSGMNFNNLKSRYYDFENRTSKFDLSLIAVESPDGIEFSLEYSTKMFKKETIQRMTMHFINILREITRSTLLTLSEIEILTEEEKKQILFDFNDTYGEYPKNKTIHQLFEEQVEKTPDNVAVVFEGESLTYRELNNKANQLADLIRKQGIRNNDPVGIMVNRGINTVVGILGIIKSGAVYVPIDPVYPDARVAYMLNHSQTKILLTESSLAQKAPFSPRIACHE
jgi:fengycin family lipopeptide synthetase D